MQIFSSHVSIIIVSNRVVLLLKGINKSFPSASITKNFGTLYGMFLIVSIPLIFYMGKGLRIIKVIFHYWKKFG